MKAIILAGGFGTRISEETDLKPKPMVEIGGKPILWHIMKYYQSFGINNFILALGYKGKMIEEFFKKNDWEIIDAARPAHNSPPPLCYSSVWLSMNVLVLDPKTVCVEASETNQMEQLDKLGFEVVPVPFRDAYAFGGGLHCATADVFREGKCENYFNFS